MPMLVPRRLPCSLDIHVATALSTSHTFTTHSELQAHPCTVCNGHEWFWWAADVTVPIR
ncbi:hypothetical protein BJV77DRAFT_989937 [Russula vinacea]|nr:hypothetical protein BJV77DRAFT_989937 [Russula vinacea]